MSQRKHSSQKGYTYNANNNKIIIIEEVIHRCFGTMDNLLIDRAVMLVCHRGKRNLSMAWIDVRKAYDSVHHDWLCAMTDVWLGEVIRKLCASSNTKVVSTTRQGRETSRKIRFMKGLPQGGRFVS